MFYKEMYIDVPFDYEKYNLNREECKAVIVNYVTDISPEMGRHNRPAVLICPGGGYDYCSEREAEPVAFRFIAYGISCFVLRYTCQRAFPQDALECAAAVKYVRENAERFDIDPDKIDIKYIEMRRKQAEILKEIYRNVSDIRTTPDTAKIISDFLHKTF